MLPAVALCRQLIGAVKATIANSTHLGQGHRNVGGMAALHSTAAESVRSRYRSFGPELEVHQPHSITSLARASSDGGMGCRVRAPI
jgi:hypothetical protein